MLNKPIARLFRQEVVTAFAGLSVLTTMLFGSLVASAQSNLIAITDQTSGNPQILVMDYAQTDWATTNPSAVVWSWRPSDSGISATGWTLPNEARLRNNSMWGGQWMATVSGGGLLAVVSYPGKVKKWSAVIPAVDNVHGIELLPNGNVAISTTNGGYVRIYSSSQGPTSTGHSADFALKQAHNVTWDPEKQLLWALGDDTTDTTKGRLVGLRVGGTSGDPTLTLAIDVPIPNAGGHDVEPVYGDTNSLYLTTGGKTWMYDKSANVVSLYQGVCCRKSINMQLTTGELVETHPVTGSPCSGRGTWCTEVVEFYSPITPYAATTTRTRAGAAIYRARVWVSDYQ